MNERQPKIYLDISAAANSKAGLGRYAASLAQALVERDADRYAFFYNSAAKIAPPLAQLWERGSFVMRRVRLGYKPWRMAVWMGQLARFHFNHLVPDAALFHAMEHLLLPLSNVPTVLTVHDLIYEIFPQHHKALNYWYLHWAMPLYCRRATAIIAVSESTKRDIVKYYDIAADKITVVHEAAAKHIRPAPPEAIAAVRTKYHLPDEFAATVGVIEPRKNHARLLDALEILHRAGLHIPLVIVGGKGWLYDEFFAKLERSPYRDAVRYLGYVPDTDLPAVLSAATLCVQPSIYEGFGLPVLEAMSCGAPVICSNTSSLPEVGGDAVRYFDPLNAAEMAEVIREVWANAELRADLRERATARAAQFSWARAAEETEEVYRELMKT